MKWQIDISGLYLSAPHSGQEEPGGRNSVRETGPELKGKNIYCGAGVLTVGRGNEEDTKTMAPILQLTLGKSTSCAI